MKRFSLVLAILLVLGVAAIVHAQTAPASPAAAASAPLKIDKGDTAWMLTSSALVLMMTSADDVSIHAV